MPNITMDEARYADPESDRTEIVQVRLPGEPLKPGNVYYDAARHKGHLTCRFCDAAVHHTKGSPTCCGDNIAGQSPHFRTERHQTHGMDCQWPKRQKTGKSYRKIEKSKGFKIHLNTSGFLGEFNGIAGRVYTRDAERKIVILNRDLIDREGRRANSIAKLIGVMEEGRFERLRDSVVVHKNHVLPWESFFVRYDRPGERGEQRFAGLIRRIKAYGPQPCLMEFNVASGVWPRRRYDMDAVKSKTVSLGIDETGKPEEVLPRLYVRNFEDTRITHGFTAAGRYLAMGYTSLKTYEDERSQRHILSIEITDHRQFAQKTLGEITAAGRKRAAKRAGRQPG